MSRIIHLNGFFSDNDIHEAAIVGRKARHMAYSHMAYSRMASSGDRAPLDLAEAEGLSAALNKLQAIWNTRQ